MSEDPRDPCGDLFIEMEAVELRILNQTILDHVDLSVRKGELLAIVGANGAGKSSLLRCMAGVWEPTAGTIRIGGLDRHSDDLAIRRFTAFLPPDPALHRLSIRENIRIFADAYGVEPADYHARMDSLLRMFDLKEKQDTNARSLSKGELKKACLAAVLCTDARLYLLDEPVTGGIDPRGYSALRRVLARLAANREITVVFATQVLELAVALADRIAVINYGRILGVGSVAELREAAHAEPEAPFSEVFARLASKDSDVPVEDFLRALEGRP